MRSKQHRDSSAQSRAMIGTLGKALLLLLFVLPDATESYTSTRVHNYKVIARRATVEPIEADLTSEHQAENQAVETTTMTRVPSRFNADDTNLDCRTPLIFLPGLDGVESHSSRSLEGLNDAYDVWRMTSSDGDRSSFMTIASIVLKHLSTFEKPAIIVGEAFGGLLAAYIGLRAKKDSVAQLVLIDPTTSFGSGIRSPLDTLLSGISSAPRDQSKSTSTSDGLSKSFGGHASSETLNWRLSKWSGVGASLMDGKFSQISTPTLVLIGKDDGEVDGKKLSKEMIGSEKLVVKRMDMEKPGEFLDFARELSKFEIPSSPLDCAFPTADDMIDVEKDYGPFLNAMSPIFLTRGKDGVLTRGLDSLPTGVSGRPVLLVGNHQLYGADCAQIIREFINSKNTLVRGLSHPMVYNDRDSNPFMTSTFKKYGAVEVSPAAIFGLLKRNETVMLFPGGAREALHGKGEEYKLFWPEKTDFVRMAGMFDAIIIPFSSVGIAESVNIFFDKEDLAKIPFVGERLIQATTMLPNARAGDVESIIPPLFLPKAPERNYFLFGEPFDTRDLNIYDKKQCKVLYKNVKDSVEDGLQTLFKFREADPYREYIPRAIYEATAGGRQAPTAPLNLN